MKILLIDGEMGRAYLFTRPIHLNAPTHLHSYTFWQFIIVLNEFH